MPILFSGFTTPTLDPIISPQTSSSSRENLLAAPGLSGVMIESPDYQSLGIGLTDRIFILGHGNGLSFNDPYQVIDMRVAIAKLQNDSTSPLVRGLLEAYYAGAKDIWIMSIGPMSEYQPNLALRDNPYYLLHALRLEAAYQILMQYDLPQIIIPMEAPFNNTKGVDFLLPLAQHCSDAFDLTGTIRLGLIGTRSGTVPFSDNDIQTMIADSRLIDTRLESFGKFVGIFAGEVTFNLQEMPTSYVGSIVSALAGWLSGASLATSLIYKPIPNAVSTIGVLSSQQINQLAINKINPVGATTRGIRGESFQVVAVTDNTIAQTGSDFWSLSQVRLVQHVIDDVRALGRRSLGTVGYVQFQHDVQSYFTALVQASLIRGFSLNIQKDPSQSGQVLVDIGVSPYFGIRTILFTTTVGPGK